MMMWQVRVRGQLVATCRKAAGSAGGSNGSQADASRSTRAVPGDDAIMQVLRQVQLGPLLERVSKDAGAGLDTNADWASMLSLGEQQRLAFARYAIIITIIMRTVVTGQLWHGN